MHFVIKIFPEVIVKSSSVRKRFIKILAQNLRFLAKRLDDSVKVIKDFDKIELKFCDDSVSREQAIQLLENIPGIAKFSEVTSTDYLDIDHISELTLPMVSSRIAGKTFVVRAKRSGNHSFTSVDVERQVGGYLLHNTEAKGVNLRYPEELVELEVRKQKLFVLGDTWKGVGGYPLGTQERVLSLISGGYDSSVSSYMSIKRGLVTHFLFFNLGGRAHEMGVKELSHYLWDKYGRSHRVNFITVPFEPVVAEILENIPTSYMGVALKRMMYRAADQIAKTHKIETLVTGEAVGQVSSQTLTNLSVIDSVCDTLVLRPLITADKGDIIDVSRKIGTEEFAISMPEYCGVISSRPTTKAKKHIIEDAETSFDFSILDEAIKNSFSESIETILDNLQAIPVDIYDKPIANSVVIDVRHPNEINDKAISFGEVKKMDIPYFKIQKEFMALDKKTTYLLYCDRGIMSRLHAELLVEAGFRNIGVLRK